jgi:Ran GTPase-activating protein (RanGAP) involved in mRNA processing and transport
MMLSAEAHESHFRAPVPSGNLHTDNRAIEVLRFLQVRHVENDVTQNSITHSHRRALIRKGIDYCQEHELPVVKESFGNLTAEARRAQGFKSWVSGLEFELETQDAGLETENYLSLMNVLSL